MSSSAADLRPLEIPRLATFDDGPGGLVRLRIATPLATAELFLHGAHLTHFQPTGAAPVLFMSAASYFASGKAIRGGVPVIFPWFGGRADQPTAPAHGFARTLPWEVESLSSSDGQTVQVVLRLESDDTTRSVWPHDFILRHRITIGAHLEMALEVENTSDREFQFEEALHTYLNVGDVRETQTTGLEGAEYVDKVAGGERKREGAEPIRITGETDRVYLGTETACVVNDPVLQRKLVVEKSGSKATVVWNPWIAKSRALADFGDEEWPRMLCIETANTAGFAVTLAAGARHVMRAVIRIG